MNINSINCLNNYANRPAFGRGRGDDKTYFQDHTDHYMGDGVYVRQPAHTYLVLDDGGMSGRQMTAAQVERNLRASGQLDPNASVAEIKRAVGERIDRFKR